MKRRESRARWLALLINVTVALIPCGCVHRILVVRTEPSGADVYIGGEKVGVTPLEYTFDVYGTLDVELRKYDEHDGYRAVHLEKELKIPWHQQFPLDFITEFLIPWPMYDVHHIDVTLQPETRTFDSLERQELEEKVKEARRALVNPAPAGSKDAPGATPALEEVSRTASDTAPRGGTE